MAKGSNPQVPHMSDPRALNVQPRQTTGALTSSPLHCGASQYSMWLCFEGRTFVGRGLNDPSVFHGSNFQHKMLVNNTPAPLEYFSIRGVSLISMTVGMVIVGCAKLEKRGITRSRFREEADEQCHAV